MNLDILTVSMSFGTLLGLLIFAMKLGALQLKVDTMWEFTLRRAKSEAVALGFATLNSPLLVKPETKHRMAAVLPALRDVYFNRGGKKLSNSALALELERHHGDKILKEVCIPCGMFLGACLVIAVQILREEDPDLYSTVDE